MSRSRADDGSCSCSPPGTSWPAAWIGRGVRAIAVRRCHLRDGVRRRRATDVRAWRGSACPLRGRRAGPAEPVSIPPLPARRWIPRCGRCCRGYSWPGNPVRAAQAVDIAALGGRHAARQLAGFLHSAADALPGREAGVRVTADLRCCGSRPTPSPCPVGCRPADVSCCARQCTPAAPLEVRQDWRLLQRDRTVLLPGRGPAGSAGSIREAALCTSAWDKGRRFRSGSRAHAPLPALRSRRPSDITPGLGLVPRFR
jgi:hypothetical protein